MGDADVKLTAENVVAPEKFSFADPKNVEAECKCEDTGARNFKCTGGAACGKAGGLCRIVMVSPGDPHLRLFRDDKTTGADDTATFVEKPPPGWRLICACLKFTDKAPTDEEKAKFPAWPKWEPPEGYQLPAKPEPCRKPIQEGGSGRWHCPKGCYLVGVDKDSKKLTIISVGGDHGGKPKDVDRYAAVFCIHLDKKP